MRTITIYPYNPTLEFLIRYIGEIQQYEKIFLASDHIGKMLKKENERYEFICGWQEGVRCSDELLLVGGLGSKEAYSQVVQYAMMAKKKIKAVKSVWNILDPKMKKSVDCLGKNNITLSANEVLHEIDAPVISVMSLGEYAGKFRIQLAMKEYFEKAGYKVILYGSSELSSLFGLEHYPDFMLEEHSMKEKILSMNHCIYKTVQREKPDLVILGCSGGIMPFNRYAHNFFGEIPLVLSKAVPIDINFIISHFLGENEDARYFEQLDLFCKENFGCENNFFTISNTSMNYNREKKQMEYMVLDKEMVKNEIRKIKYNKLFDSMSNANLNRVFQGMKEMLEADYQVL